MILPTKQFTIYKPKITDDGEYWAAIYKEVKRIKKDDCSAEPISVFSSKTEADLKASQNTAKPPPGEKP